MAPIHVVELMNVPAELKIEEKARRVHVQPRIIAGKGARIVRTRYGAWYLPTNLWKVSRSNEVSLRPLYSIYIGSL